MVKENLHYQENKAIFVEIFDGIFSNANSGLSNYSIPNNPKELKKALNNPDFYTTLSADNLEKLKKFLQDNPDFYKNFYKNDEDDENNEDGDSGSISDSEENQNPENEEKQDLTDNKIEEEEQDLTGDEIEEWGQEDDQEKVNYFQYKEVEIGRAHV